jgi:hypothetical protein
VDVRRSIRGERGDARWRNEQGPSHSKIVDVGAVFSDTYSA